MACEEEKPICSDEPSQTQTTEQMACEEEKPICSDEPSQTQTTEQGEKMICEDATMCGQSSCEGEQKTCESQLPQIQTVQQMDCEEEEPTCSDEPPQTQTTEQMVCEEMQPACRDESIGIIQQSSCEGEQKTCESQLPQIQTVQQMACEEEEPTCSDEPPQTQTTEQMSVEGEKMICEDDTVCGQNNHDEEMISCNKESSESQSENQTEVFKAQQTCMEVEPCVQEQSHTQPTEQNADDGGQTCEQEVQGSEQMDCKEEQKRCNKDSSQTQTAEQSSQDDQNSSHSDVDERVSSDEEFIVDSDTDSDTDSKASVTSTEVEIPPDRNHLVTRATKKNFCFVCGQACAKISRHLKLHRHESVEIAKAFKLQKSSKERKHILEVLRNKGNFQHNNQVLNKGSGLIKVVRTPKNKIDTHNFEYCMYCKGLFIRKELWRHLRRCASNPDRDMPKGTKSKVLGLAAIAKCPHLQHISEDVRKMLCEMHQDEVAQIVRNDEYVLRLAQDFLNEKSKAKDRHAFVRQTIRYIGKFLIILKKKSLRNLAEAVKPTSFPKVIEAVREMAEFNEATNSFVMPSLARRIGLILRKFCILTAEKAYAVHDRRLIQSTSSFLKLFSCGQAHFALGDTKLHTPIFSNPPLLPFVQDVKVLHCYLEKASQCALKELKEKSTAQGYADLSKVTLAQILMYNRRHGEVSQMTIKDFQEGDKVQVPEDTLTEFEKEFCKHCSKIKVKQKMEGHVTIILTPEMIDALMLLIEKREQCSVSGSNIFAFGKPNGRRYYRGENALRICARESGTMNPEQLRSAAFSRHIATLTQVLSLKNQELRKLAKYIGHDISVRKEYYRLPEATARLTKICKLILAIEKGIASHLLGESLDDIALPDQLYESDSEDDFEEECANFEQRRAKLMDTSKKKETRPTKTSKAACTGSTKTPVEFDTATKATKQAVKAESLAQTVKKSNQNKKNVTRKSWTRAERAAVLKHFKKHICNGILASMAECQRCQILEQPVLNRRTLQNIRDFVRNAGKCFKKGKAAGDLENPFVLTPQVANTPILSTAPPPATYPTNTNAVPSLTLQAAKPTISCVVSLQTATVTSLAPQAGNLICANVTPHQVADQGNSSLLTPQAVNLQASDSTSSSVSQTESPIVPFLITEDQTNSSTPIPHAAKLASSSSLKHTIVQPAEESSNNSSKLTTKVATTSIGLAPETANPNSTSILTPEVANSDVPPPQVTNITCFAILPPDTAFVYYPVTH